MRCVNLYLRGSFMLDCWFWFQLIFWFQEAGWSTFTISRAYIPPEMFFQAKGTFALPTPTTSIHYGPPYGLTYQFNIILLGMFRIIDKKKVKLVCGILFFFCWTWLFPPSPRVVQAAGLLPSPRGVKDALRTWFYTILEILSNVSHQNHKHLGKIKFLP